MWKCGISPHEQLRRRRGDDAEQFPASSVGSTMLSFIRPCWRLINLFGTGGSVFTFICFYRKQLRRYGDWIVSNLTQQSPSHNQVHTNKMTKVNYWACDLQMQTWKFPHVLRFTVKISVAGNTAKQKYNTQYIIFKNLKLAWVYPPLGNMGKLSPPGVWPLKFTGEFPQ